MREAKAGFARFYLFEFRAGMALIIFVSVICFIGIFLPLDYNVMDSENRFTPPGLNYLMGTDNFGRDVFLRVVVGARYTLLTALLTVAGSAALGSALGLFSGFAGGIWDEVIMRLMDTLSSFPGILLALVMISLMGNSPGTLIIALLILFIPGFTRIMRNGMLQYKDKDFVLVARIAGVPKHRIIFIHILPNL